MNQKYHIGDYVIHKKSRQKMLVLYDYLESFSDQPPQFKGIYRCGWTDNNGFTQIEDYPENQLDKFT